MALEDIFRLQERISRTLDHVAKIMNNSIPMAGSLFLEQYNRTIQMFNAIMRTPDYFSGITATLAQFQQNIISISDIDYQGIYTTISEVARISGNVANSLASFNFATYQNILDSLINTLARVEPYLPPEKKEECEKVILPKLSKEPKTKLTLGEILAILSLLVSILFGIIASRPSDQLERLIEQNEIIIAQQQNEIAQLNEEDKKLLNALESLTDSINLLSEEAELLRNKLEGSENTSDGQPLPDTEDSQENQSNAEK